MNDDDKPSFDPTAAYEQKQREAESLYRQEAAAGFDADRALAVKRLRRTAATVVLICILLPVLWKLGFLSRGFDRRRVTFDSPATSSRRGVQFGSTTIFATTGQTLAVRYKAQAARGFFRIWIRQKTLGMLGPVEASTGNLRSGDGTLQFVVPRNGLYMIMIDGSPDGNGYDVTYDVSWSTK